MLIKNAKILKGHHGKIYTNVHACRGYEKNPIMQEHCTTSCLLHDLTLSLLGLALLPGYNFLWQHLSQGGEQQWKDSGNWLLCILWTGSPNIEIYAGLHTWASLKVPFDSVQQLIFSPHKQNELSHNLGYRQFHANLLCILKSFMYDILRIMWLWMCYV